MRAETAPPVPLIDQGEPAPLIRKALSISVSLIQREPITAAVLCLGLGFLLAKLTAPRTEASTSPLPGDPWGDRPDTELGRRPPSELATGRQEGQAAHTVCQS